jgi:hypothetical protein
MNSPTLTNVSSLNRVPSQSPSQSPSIFLDLSSPAASLDLKINVAISNSNLTLEQKMAAKSGFITQFLLFLMKYKIFFYY